MSPYQLIMLTLAQKKSRLGLFCLFSLHCSALSLMMNVQGLISMETWGASFFLSFFMSICFVHHFQQLLFLLCLLFGCG